jgi:hypothetical protein
MIHRPTRYRALPDAPYDPRVTRLDAPLNAPPGAGAFDPATGNISPGAVNPVTGLPVSGPGRRFYNRNVASMNVVQLTANNSIRLLPYNDRRSGLQINNRDATNALVYSFGNDAGFNGIALAAGGMALYDFTTPPDSLYLISAANILIVVLEITRRD